MCARDNAAVNRFLRFLALSAWLSLLAPPAAAAAKDEPAAHPAAALVKRADHARRANLEEARRLADEALALIAAQPDADLRVLLRKRPRARTRHAGARHDPAAARQARRPAGRPAELRRRDP